MKKFKVGDTVRFTDEAKEVLLDADNYEHEVTWISDIDDGQILHLEQVGAVHSYWLEKVR